MLVGLLGAVVLRRTPRKIGRIGIALGVPLVVLLPWWPSVITAPGRLFTGPDSALDGVGRPRRRSGGCCSAAGWVPGCRRSGWAPSSSALIWLVALVGLARRPDRRAVAGRLDRRALLAFAMAVVLSRLVVSVPPVGTEVRPWVGAYLLIGFGALDPGAAAVGRRRALDRR